LRLMQSHWRRQHGWRRRKPPMRLKWNSTEHGIWFANAGNSQTGPDLYLVVEELPLSEGWDWTVWQLHPSLVIRSGKQRSSSDAAAAAEAAARNWDGSEMFLAAPKRTFAGNLAEP
jgi:hypothetical protein